MSVWSWLTDEFLAYPGADTVNEDTASSSTDDDETVPSVPYDQWPTDCYVCDETLLESQRRGQFVVQRGEYADEIAAVPLCPECATLFAHMLNHHDEVIEYMAELQGPPE